MSTRRQSYKIYLVLKNNKLILLHNLNLNYNTLIVDLSNVLEMSTYFGLYNDEFYYFKGFSQEVVSHNIDMKNVNS